MPVRSLQGSRVLLTVSFPGDSRLWLDGCQDVDIGRNTPYPLDGERRTREGILRYQDKGNTLTDWVEIHKDPRHIARKKAKAQALRTSQW